MPEFKDRDRRHIYVKPPEPEAAPEPAPPPPVAWRRPFEVWLEGVTDGTLAAQSPAQDLVLTRFRRQGLREVLDLLAKRPDLRAAVLAAADPDIAPPVRPRVEPADEASGVALWRASERRAATLYRRALDDGGGAPLEGSQAIDAALARAGAGQHLPDDVRREMEQALGVSLAGVRIHVDGVADAAAKAAHAHAFTVGEDVFFAAGAFAPGTRAGKELLAHELAHVVQGWQGQTAKPAGKLATSRPHDPLERDAEAVARRAVAEPVPVVQRRARGVPERITPATLSALVAGSRGEAIPDALRGSLEQQLGPLGSVRIHTDEPAARAAERLSAEAFAVDQDIYFAAGAFDPRTTAGQRLIAHEVAHTVQARGSTRGAELEISDPGDVHEQSADAFAEAFVAAPRIVPPDHREAPRLIQPMGRARLSRHPGKPYIGPTIDDGNTIGISDIELFPIMMKSKTFNHVDKQVPLAKGLMMVGEVPVTYNAEAGLVASSWLAGTFGPGTINGVRVQLSKAEKVLHDLADEDPVVGVYPLGPFGPKVGVGPSPRGLYDKALLQGTHHASGWANVGASASAGTMAKASISGGVDVLDTFGGGATGSLTASASARADANAHMFVGFTYSGGSATLTSLKLSSELSFAWDLKLTAEAGVYVELKMPEIPVITELSHVAQKVPIVNWFVPDLKKMKWRKDFTKSWDLVDKKGVGAWKKEWDVVTGSSAGSPATLGMTDDGFDLGDLVKEQLGGAKPKKDIPEKDDGPDKELKDGASPGAVASTRQSAKAQAKSARDDIKRERTWNKSELGKAVAAVKKAAGKVKTASAAAPVPLAIGAGGTPEQQHQAALEKREEKLESVDEGVQNIDKKIDEVQAAAEDKPDGPSRNYAREGYTALGKSADSVGQDVAGYGAHAEEYERPVPPGAVQNADTADAEKARLEARKALDEADEKVDTELIRLDKVWQDASAVPSLSVYMANVDAHRADIRIQVARPLAKYNKEWEDVPTTFPVPHEQAQAYRTIIIPDATKASATLDTLKPKEPKQPWDTTYAVLENRQLLLIPSYRSKDMIRSKMYPDGKYNADAKSWMEGKLVKSTIDNKEYWKYTGDRYGRQNLRGDDWWLLNDSKEKPTIDHAKLSVARHWNSVGHDTDQPSRAKYFSGSGNPEAELEILPVTVNSAKGNKEDKVPYEFKVTVRFRGSGSGKSPP